MKRLLRGAPIWLVVGYIGFRQLQVERRSIKFQESMTQWTHDYNKELERVFDRLVKGINKAFLRNARRR